MVVWLAFRMGQYRVNDHTYHAPQFTRLGVFSKMISNRVPGAGAGSESQNEPPPPDGAAAVVAL